MRFRFLVSWFAFCKALKRCSFLFEIRIIEPMISILTTTWIKNAVIGIEPMTYRLWACRATTAPYSKDVVIGIEPMTSRL